MRLDTMLDLIRVGAGYTGIDADVSRIDEAKNLGLIRTMSASEFNSIKQKVNSLEDELKKASSMKYNASEELEIIDKKLRSAVYTWVPFKFFTSGSINKMELTVSKQLVHERYNTASSEYDALRDKAFAAYEPINGYYTINDVYVKSTIKGLKLLPESIATELDGTWSGDNHATYMIAANLANSNIDKFLEASILARTIVRNWSNESHSRLTIASVLCDNDEELLSKCWSYALETDNSWSPESRALYTIAAAIVKGEKKSYDKAINCAWEIDSNRPIHAFYTIASILCNNDSERIKKAWIKATMDANYLSRVSQGAYMIAAALNQDYDTNTKAVNLAKALNKGQSIQSQSIYTIAALCENRNISK